MSNVILTHPPSFSPLQSPPKGVTIPYRPKPSGSPVIFAGGQVHTTRDATFLYMMIWGLFIASVVCNIGLYLGMHICAEFHMLRNHDA